MPIGTVTYVDSTITYPYYGGSTAYGTISAYPVSYSNSYSNEIGEKNKTTPKIINNPELKVKKHRMPRIIRLSLYLALVFFVWKVVLNITPISLFIINLLTNHAK